MEIDRRNRHERKQESNREVCRCIAFPFWQEFFFGSASAANAQVELENYVDSSGYIDTRCKESRGLK